MQQNIKKSYQYAQKRIIPYSIICFFVLTALQILIIFLAFRYFTLAKTKSELRDFTLRVSQGLSYKNGRWDTSKYTADPATPHPSGSSGFSTPLYIIGSDGFVIERNAPISGFLDSADFSHLLEFQTAQNISVVTNEQWRLLSRPIIHNGKTIGAIVVAMYHPERFVATVSDKKLSNTIGYLQSNLVIHNGQIDASKIDLRGIDYDVSFEIVSNFNKVLLNNGRMPTFIDKSYVYHELEKNQEVRTVRDPIKNTPYLIVMKTLYDDEKNPVGIVMAGKSVGFISTIFAQTLPYTIGFLLFATVLSMYLLSNLIMQSISEVLEIYDRSKMDKPLPTAIHFNAKQGSLYIDDHIVDIPLDSNQYYFCKTIFSNSKKRWELDELLTGMGDDSASDNWRKVYDTMTIINKKVAAYLPVKLVELKEKTYFLNPDLQSLIKTSQNS